MTSLSLFRSSSAVSQFCMRISDPNLPQRAFNVFLSSLPVAWSKNMNIYWFQILFWNHGHKKLWWCSFTSRTLRMFKAVSSMNCLYQLCVTCTYHWSWKYESILTLSVIIIIIIYIHGRAMQYSSFFVILGSLIKQCILFEINFSCSSPSPHPIQGWNSEKILDTPVQHCLRGEGRGWTCVNWKCPEMQKCPKTYDCCREERKLLPVKQL